MGDAIKLKPIADVHLKSRNCDKAAFKRYIADSDENTRFIGVGDLLDCIITSDTKRYTKANDESETDEIIDESIAEAEEILRPVADRILGLGIGNHEQNIVKRCNTNPIKVICKDLNVPYLGYSFLLRLIFRGYGNSPDKPVRSHSVIVRGHHGYGGGSRTQGADLTKFAKDMQYFDADIFMYGHVHKTQHDKVPRLALRGDRLISKPKFLVICGTFLKTYSDSTDATYSEIEGYPPTAIGSPTIIIKPNTNWVDIKIDS
jgi:UDP-2,3-diacylglucosamine pyrophosphatase LpxH